PISVAVTLGSHFNSSWTSICSCSSVFTMQFLKPRTVEDRTGHRARSLASDKPLRISSTTGFGWFCPAAGPAPGRSDFRAAALLVARVPLGNIGIDPDARRSDAGDVHLARRDAGLVRQFGRGGCPALLLATDGTFLRRVAALARCRWASRVHRSTFLRLED